MDNGAKRFSFKTRGNQTVCMGDLLDDPLCVQALVSCALQAAGSVTTLPTVAPNLGCECSVESAFGARGKRT